MTAYPKVLQAEAPEASPRARQGLGALLNPNLRLQLGRRRKGKVDKPACGASPDLPPGQRLQPHLPEAPLVPQDGGAFPLQHSPTAWAPQPIRPSRTHGPAGRTDEEAAQRTSLPQGHRDEALS